VRVGWFSPQLGAVMEAHEIEDREHLEQLRQRVRMQLEYPQGAVQIRDGVPEIMRPPRRTARNLCTILSRDPEFHEALRHNEHSNVVEYKGEPLTDTDVTSIRLRIAALYGLEAAAPTVHELSVWQAQHNAFHPVREYLEGVTWDGAPRLDDFLVRLAGAPDTEITRTLTRRWAISAVARIMQPGAKVDTVLVLVGAQGLGKSTLFSALGGAWFKDTPIDLRTKDAYIALRGAWLYELAELAATRPRDSETVKAFLSAPVDHYRPPYGRNEVAQKRQCVFVGTTNEATFLNDPSGARRFWPIAVEGRIEPARVAAERDQLWAEAVTAYRARERWWLELNEADALTDAQDQYQTGDPWGEVLRIWTTAPDNRGGDGWTSEYLLAHALEVPTERQQKFHLSRVGNVMRSLGFSRVRNRVDGERARRWLPSE
jgi:putative DNA primase/helicase